MNDHSNVARKIAALVASGGPDVTPESARALAADLHQAARHAIEIVADVTGLASSVHTAGMTPVYVLDRPGWAYAAAQSFTRMEHVAGRSVHSAHKIESLGVGIVVAVLSRMILGQFDPFSSPLAGISSVPEPLVQRATKDDDEPWRGYSSCVQGRSSEEGQPGRLLLNAPTIESFRAKYDLDQRDLCLWICVHELTHAVQFAAAPWLREYIVSHFIAVLEDPYEDGSLSSPSAQALNTAMSVLEGHAQFVMNAVELVHIPSKGRLIAALEERRARSHPLKRQLAYRLGLDKKMAQYQTGADFIQYVVLHADMSVVNLLWRNEKLFPSSAELVDPAQWLERVQGVQVSDSGDANARTAHLGVADLSEASVNACTTNARTTNVDVSGLSAVKTGVASPSAASMNTRAADFSAGSTAAKGTN